MQSLVQVQNSNLLVYCSLYIELDYCLLSRINRYQNALDLVKVDASAEEYWKGRKLSLKSRLVALFLRRHELVSAGNITGQISVLKAERPSINRSETPHSLLCHSAPEPGNLTPTFQVRFTWDFMLLSRTLFCLLIFH